MNWNLLNEPKFCTLFETDLILNGDDSIIKKSIPNVEKMIYYMHRFTRILQDRIEDFYDNNMDLILHNSAMSTPSPSIDTFKEPDEKTKEFLIWFDQLHESARKKEDDNFMDLLEKIYLDNFDITSLESYRFKREVSGITLTIYPNFYDDNAHMYVYGKI